PALVGLGTIVERPAQLSGPELTDALDDPVHRAGILIGGTEVPRAGMLWRDPQCLGKNEVAAERVEHVLPGANRLGAAYPHPLAAAPPAHDVRPAPTASPTAAADHVDCTSGSQASAPRVGEEGASEGRRRKLGTALRARIGIVPAQRLVLAIAPLQLPVLVAL